VTNSQKVRKAYIHFLWVAMAVVAAFLLWVLYLLLYPYNDISVTGPTTISGEGDVITETGEHSFHPGDFVEVSNEEFCNQGVQTTVTRLVSNEYGSVELPTLAFQAPAEPVCIAPSVALIRIPDEVPPGVWHITITTTYEPNPIRKIDVTFKTPDFEVLPRGDK